MRSKRSFQKCLERYAELIVTRAVGLLPGQVLIISGESPHEAFAKLVAEAAYRHGAKYVDWIVSNPWLRKMHLSLGDPGDYGYIPPHAAMVLNQLVTLGGAVLSLRGPEEPDLFGDIDPRRVQAMANGRKNALEAFYSKGINGAVHWSIACVATQGWAKRIFPKKLPAKAEALLWEEIFRITGADRPDCLKRWDELDRTLQKRVAKLDALCIETLLFEGNGTKLRVGLSPKAKWLGGSLASKLDKSGKRRTAPNNPSFETFTTPDLRRTEGVLKATTPVWINGTLVEGLVVHFKKGKVVRFSARKGKAAFAAMIKVDKGAKFLGEIALVGIDSPIYRSGLIFEETLLDENQACHGALGSAYIRGIRGGERLSKQDLAALGVNSSAVHHDIMFSNEHTNLTAFTYGGKKVALILNGRWVI